MRIGAHVSTAGGVDKAIDRAQAIGAECIQIFGSQPQTWRRRLYDDTQAQTFQLKSLEMDVAPTFLHGIYLINLATSNPDNLERSQEALVHDMHIAAQLGAAGVIFHTGSHKGAGYDHVFPQIVEAVRKVLDLSPSNVWLLLENSAGMGDGIGSKFSELGRIVREVGDDRLRVCLDTQHTYAAGYNIASADGLAETLEEFDRDIGLSRLAAIHANDSKVPLGGGVDRHENIGEGFIGKEGFEIIVQHDAFANVPFLLEVPGFEKKGPDKENINILRELAGLDPIPYPVEQSL
jgi:deoxyribonuclease-4